VNGRARASEGVVNPEFRRRVNRGVGGIVVGAWGGAAAFYLGQYVAALVALSAGLVFSFYSVWRVVQELDLEPGLAESEAARWREILWLAPAALPLLWMRVQYLEARGGMRSADAGASQQEAAPAEARKVDSD